MHYQRAGKEAEGAWTKDTASRNEREREKREERPPRHARLFAARSGSALSGLPFFFFLLFAARALKETRCALVFESPFRVVSPDLDAMAKLRWS
jgi:hypothetical protein